ncbi:MAG: GH3 auxin-responsive promoter family protein, partial [Rudanella sp.]|nr:GH3 auxin-responsive promoter family protein [Rudanella sp.]
MSILGNVLKRGIRLTQIVRRRRINALKMQRQTFTKLIGKARYTTFGEQYQFDELLRSVEFGSDREFYEKYKKLVPIHDYNKIYSEWWHRSLDGEKNVTWPGRVKHFALSSGTSESASKYIPVTKSMVKAIQITGVRQILTLSKYRELPASTFEKGCLMLGGSTKLNNRGGQLVGDLSGITTSQIPFWFQRFYKPGKEIAQERDWALKLD